MIPPEWHFPNAWMKFRRAAIVRFLDADTVRLSFVSGKRRRTVYEGPLDGLGPTARKLPSTAFRVAVAPASLVLVRTLNAKAPSEKVARSVLPGLLDTELPFPLEQSVHGFPQVIRDTGGAHRAMALAIRETDLQGLVNRLAAQSFEPDVVDHPGLGLWTQSVHELPPKRREPPRRIALHLDEHETLVAIGAMPASGKRPQLFHLQTLPPLLLGRPGPLAEAQSLQRVVQTQFGPDYNTDQCVVSLAGPLANAFATANPGNTRLHEKPAAESLLDRAAAHRALKNGPLRFNLLPGQPDLQRRLNRRNRKGAIHLFAVAALIAAGAFAVHRVLDQQEDKVQRELTQAASEFAGFDVPKGRELAEAKLAAAGDLEPSGFLEAFAGTHTGAEPLRQLLTGIRAANVPVERISIQSNTTAVVLQGQPDLPDVRFPDHNLRTIRDATHTHLILEP